MLHDTANDDGYVVHKQAAEDRQGWRKDIKNLLYSRLLLMMMMMMMMKQMTSQITDL